MTGALLLASTREELDALLASRRTAGDRVALVPTMGALHEGHASLMREARRCVGDGTVVASVFVNPLQFGAGEDLDRYPRTLEADLDLCAREAVDVVCDPLVTVDPGPLGTLLEGASRPGHFLGMLIVVAKLFGMVRPEVAVFGQKDYQQLVLVRRMSRDLCLRVDVVGAETVREPDGLALSSRNAYLGPDDRRVAVTLSRALRAAQDAAADGPRAAYDAAAGVFGGEPAVVVDYLAVLDPDLAEAPPHGEGRVLVAARVGNTRLIDNLPLVLGQHH